MLKKLINFIISLFKSKKDKDKKKNTDDIYPMW